jgi:hypothetical protein
MAQVVEYLPGKHTSHKFNQTPIPQITVIVIPVSVHFKIRLNPSQPHQPRLAINLFSDNGGGEQWGKLPTPLRLYKDTNS